MPMGGFELLIILAIILLFFGARRLPELGRSLGKTQQEFRKAAVGDSDKKDELRERKENEELSSSRREEVLPEEERARAEHEQQAHTDQRP